MVGSCNPPHPSSQQVVVALGQNEPQTSEDPPVDVKISQSSVDNAEDCGPRPSDRGSMLASFSILELQGNEDRQVVSQQIHTL